MRVERTEQPQFTVVQMLNAETDDRDLESLLPGPLPHGVLIPVPESPSTAFAQPMSARPCWPTIGLAVVAAAFIVGHSVFHATAVDELLLVLVALIALVAGHGLMRNRARRVAAEQEAARVREELVLQARVGDCEQRRQSLAAFAKLASHVAHEVRNPLSSIMLNTELLEEEAAKCGCEGASEASVLIGSIKMEAERLQRLTDEYLAFARPPRPSAAHQSLNAVAEELAHLVREEARRAGIVVETRMSHGCPCAVIDPHQIKQAALNLVRNATQAMPGGGRLTISTEVRSDGAVAMHVEDTGPGIPEELRCRIFEPFFTSKPQGTGLGLPLAAHIVRDHGGEIDFGPAPGGGTRFTIKLPPSRAESGPCACSPLQPGPLEVVST
jgi:signal transduction histidine kinase